MKSYFEGLEIMTTSVVITTFNGERYIIEQLKSIANQTQRPDEVLILDDCSTDKTVDVVRSYIDEENLSSTWKLIINEKNLGWKENFLKGFNLANSDLIFPCDQDDIWDHDKIFRMAEVMQRAKDIDVLCCNLQLIAEDGMDPYLAPFNLNPYGTGKLEKVIFNKMWMNPLRQGCTMCFKRDIVQILNRVWFTECPHDLALWALGMSRSSLYIYNDKLITFRRHQGVSTPSNRKIRSIQQKNMDIYIELGTNIFKSGSYSSENLHDIQKMIEFYKKRKESINKFNIYKHVLMLRYIKYYPRVRTWCSDVISSFIDR